MKSLYFSLRLAQLCGGGEALADSLTIDLAGQTEVRSVARLVGLMTMTVRFSTATVDRGNGAATKITDLQDLGQDAGAVLLEGSEGIGQGGTSNPNV